MASHTAEHLVGSAGRRPAPRADAGPAGPRRRPRSRAGRPGRTMRCSATTRAPAPHAEHREQDQSARQLAADPRAADRSRHRRRHHQDHRQRRRGRPRPRWRQPATVMARPVRRARRSRGRGPGEPSGSKRTPVTTSTVPSGDRVTTPISWTRRRRSRPRPEVDDHVDRRAQLAVRGLAGEAGRQGETLHAARHVGRGVGVDGRAPTLVAGVHRREHVDHLGAAHLADDQPVRSHPQRLPHQRAQR